MTRAARRPGSVRFAPYWKVQWWEARSLAWRDVQQSFDAPADAEREAPSLIPADAQRWRLMRVSMEGREPSEPRERSAA